MFSFQFLAGQECPHGALPFFHACARGALGRPRGAASPLPTDSSSCLTGCNQQRRLLRAQAPSLSSYSPCRTSSSSRPIPTSGLRAHLLRIGHCPCFGPLQFMRLRGPPFLPCTVEPSFWDSPFASHVLSGSFPHTGAGLLWLTRCSLPSPRLPPVNPVLPSYFLCPPCYLTFRLQVAPAHR